MIAKEVTEARREQVWQLVILRGVSESVVAKHFGVHRNTICNDIAVLPAQNRNKVRDTDILEEIGEHTKKFDDMYQKAMVDYATAETSAAKASFYQNALSALDKKWRFLAEVGILPKAAQEITGKLMVEGADINTMSLESLRGLREQVLEKLTTMKSGKKLTGVNRIAAEPIDVQQIESK
jgi:hypothetical protein